VSVIAAFTALHQGSPPQTWAAVFRWCSGHLCRPGAVNGFLTTLSASGFDWLSRSTTASNLQPLVTIRRSCTIITIKVDSCLIESLVMADTATSPIGCRSCSNDMQYVGKLPAVGHYAAVRVFKCQLCKMVHSLSVEMLVPRFATAPWRADPHN
jgi:hypothetical protein